MPIKKTKSRKATPKSLKAVTMLPAGVKSTGGGGVPLSPQQQAVVTWVKKGTGSAFVEAVAGSGKTTTLVEACRGMSGSVALAAFNKSIAEEIKVKTAQVAPGVRVGTFHSFGFSAWRRVAQLARVDADGKSRQMMEAVGAPYELRSAVRKLVSLGKQSVVGIPSVGADGLWSVENADGWREIAEHFDIGLSIEAGVDGSEDAAIDHAIELAQAGIKWSRSVGKSVVDFDDMLWLPLVDHAPVWANDWVLVDEAQDTNAARRMLARRMLKPTGRSVWVGDRHQAIYGFTGADADAVDMIVRDFGCTSLPLTVTFRCCKEAVKVAQRWVPHITAAEGNPVGRVVTWGSSKAHQEIVRVGPGDAVLCRLTKPLVSLAFELIRNGTGCHVEGRDIGKSLELLATKWKVDTARALTMNLEAYRAREVDRLVAKDAGEAAVNTVNDRVDTLLVIMEGCDTVDQVVGRIRSLFDDVDTEDGKRRTVTLSTVHKAKGREWDRVIILGFGQYMPSSRARLEWEKRQEGNLCYVAVTRAKSELVLSAAVE